MILKTKRLVLRPANMKDIDAIVENINNLRVSKWLLVVPYPYKRKDAIYWINSHKKQEKKKDSYDFAIELNEEKRIIGGCGLKKVDINQGTAKVGYWIGEKYWKKGYGSEALEALINIAFKKLKLRRLEADVFVGNPFSGLLLEKFGFKKEGLRRKACKSKATGKIYDEYVYGLLKEEYKVKK